MTKICNGRTTAVIEEGHIRIILAKFGRNPTRTYMLQSTSRANVSATCKCCRLYDEDLAHMLLECPVFLHQRKPIFSQIKNQIINCIGAQHQRELFNDRDSLVKLILDCSRYSIINEKPEYHEILNTSADLIYRLHITRINKLSSDLKVVSSFL